MNNPITESLKILSNYFEKQKIDYVVVGGVAVLVYGRIRATDDIDIIIDHHKIDREHFIQYLRENGFDANISDLEALDENLHASIFLKDQMFRIDLKGKNTQKDQDSINGAVDAIFDTVPIKIDHPQSLVLNKLIFGSEQDFEDALAVYVRNPKLIDLDKLRTQAKIHGIEKITKEFIQEIEEFFRSKSKNSE